MLEDFAENAFRFIKNFLTGLAILVGGLWVTAAFVTLSNVGQAYKQFGPHWFWLSLVPFFVLIAWGISGIGQLVRNKFDPDGRK